MPSLLCCGGIDVSGYKLEPYKVRFEPLGLRGSDVEDLFRVFIQIDDDATGDISIPELSDFIHLPDSNLFANRVFQVFDEDGSGQITFGDFAVSLWHYCIMDHTALVLFAFDIYDISSKGFLSIKDADNLLREFYGDGYQSNEVAMRIHEHIRAVTTGDKEGLGFSEFQTYCKNHQALLYPAFEFQRRLQKRICGIAFWERVGDNVVEVNGIKCRAKDLLKDKVQRKNVELILKKASAAAEDAAGTLAERRARRQTLQDSPLYHAQKSLRNLGSHMTSLASPLNGGEPNAIKVRVAPMISRAAKSMKNILKKGNNAESNDDRELRRASQGPQTTLKSAKRSNKSTDSNKSMENSRRHSSHVTGQLSNTNAQASGRKGMSVTGITILTTEDKSDRSDGYSSRSPSPKNKAKEKSDLGADDSDMTSSSERHGNSRRSSKSVGHASPGENERRISVRPSEKTSSAVGSAEDAGKRRISVRPDPKTNSLSSVQEHSRRSSVSKTASKSDTRVKHNEANSDESDREGYSKRSHDRGSRGHRPSQDVRKKSTLTGMPNAVEQGEDDIPPDKNSSAKISSNVGNHRHSTHERSLR